MLTRRQWKKFCCDDDPRYDLSNPFVVDGWKYATDTRVLVREPTTARNTKGRVLPSADVLADLFNKNFRRRKDFTRILPARNENIKPCCGIWPAITFDGCVFDSRRLVMICDLGSVKYKPENRDRLAIALRTGSVEILLSSINLDCFDVKKLQSWE